MALAGIATAIAMALSILAIIFLIAYEQVTGVSLLDSPGPPHTPPGSSFLPSTQRPPATRVPVPDLDDCNVDELAHEPTEDNFIVVSRVVDGDTVEAEGMTDRVGLWGIDAPEPDQPGGRQATEYLASILPAGALMKTQVVGRDRSGRLMAVVGTKDEWAVNFKMVWAGWAFAYKGASDSHNPCLHVAQRHARIERNGVWGMFPYGGTRPWEWRHRNGGR